MALYAIWWPDGALVIFGANLFISLFSADIRDALSLSHGEFGTYYAMATAASAFTLLWLGKMADTVPLKKLSFITLTCICLSAIHFAFVQSVIMLTIGIYLLRLWGQGMMSHVWSTAMARRYVKARGRTLAFASFGMTIAESLWPALVVGMLAVMNWRLVWIIIPLIAFVSLAPFINQLTKRSALQDGAGFEGLSSQNKDKPSLISPAKICSKIVPFGWPLSGLFLCPHSLSLVCYFIRFILQNSKASIC